MTTTCTIAQALQHWIFSHYLKYSCPSCINNQVVWLMTAPQHRGSAFCRYTIGPISCGLSSLSILETHSSGMKALSHACPRMALWVSNFCEGLPPTLQKDKPIWQTVVCTCSSYMCSSLYGLNFDPSSPFVGLYLRVRLKLCNQKNQLPILLSGQGNIQEDNFMYEQEGRLLAKLH